MPRQLMPIDQTHQATTPKASKAASATAATTAATDTVTAVTRAMKILESFAVLEHPIYLAAISRHTGLHKTTALRIARTLAAQHYLVQREDSSWRLGRAAGALGANYQASFNVHDVIESTLRELSVASGESASFYVREGDVRTCVLRVEGPQAIRHHIRMGANLPLNLGAPGRVILAFSGTPGEPYESIRRRGFHLSMGERELQVSSVAAPIFEGNWRLLGSLCISGPSARLQETRLLELSTQVVEAASQVSYALSGRRLAPPDQNLRATWHPE